MQKRNLKEKVNNNGITLIALIITIIVMLILVGVTINVALNGGLFTQAQDAASDTQKAAEREQLLSAVVTAYDTKTGLISQSKLESNLGTDWSVDGPEGGPYTVTSPKGNVFTVDANGNISDESENGGTPEGDNTVPDELKKYILGADGNGRIFMGESEGESGIFNGTFLDDPLTEEVDETQTLGLEAIMIGSNDDYAESLIYVKYNDKAYKIIIIEVDGKNTSKDIQFVYEPKGTEGQKTADNWTILYDNGETAEAVSPTAMGELRLGHSETATTEGEKVTEAIESYNNAITLINNYCKTLEGLPSNSKVRSVGASTDISDKYYSDKLATWNGTCNGIVKKGDMKYEQDLVRMAYWGVVDGESSYWMASRCTNALNDSYIDFSVRYVDFNAGTPFDTRTLWEVESSGDSFGYGETHAVRPVITIENI